MSPKNQSNRKASSARAVPSASRTVNWGRIGVWFGSITVVVGLTALVVSGADSSGGDRPEPPPGTELIAVEGALHIPGGVDYPDIPPAGGAHDPTPLACGFYDFVVPDENAVHSLEHGVVWVTYQPGVTGEELDVLRDIGRSRETIVSLLPDQGSSIIGTAWGAQVRLDSATDPRLEQFVDAFRDAPTSPEPFASCAGGAVPSHS